MKNKTLITLSITLSFILSIIYSIVTGNFELLDKIIEATQVPLGVIVAYYFGIRHPEK